MALFHTMPQTSAFPFFFYLYPFWITTSWTKHARGAERKKERQKTISCFVFCFLFFLENLTTLHDSPYILLVKKYMQDTLHYFKVWSFRFFKLSSCLLSQFSIITLQ
jgi:hypothetical protein